MADYEIAIMRLEGGVMGEERVSADNLYELQVALRSVTASLTNEIMINGCSVKEMLEHIISQHSRMDDLSVADNRIMFATGTTVRTFSTSDTGVPYAVFIAFGPARYVEDEVVKFSKYN